MQKMNRWLFLISLGIAGGLLFRKYGIEGIYVASPSMEPALPVGTHYFLDKFTFNFREPRRGEIIVFASPLEDEKDLIKRVIALPGDTVSIKEKQLYLNGEKLVESYARYTRKDELLVGDNLAEIKVPEHSYFVLGDNRDESKDSSTWKDVKTGENIYFIHANMIKGRLMNVLE